MKNNSIISKDDGFSLDDWSEIEEGLFCTSRNLKEEVAGKTNRILFGNKIDGDEINFLNKDNEVRVLSGIKRGRLAEDSTEVVNGSQLYSMYEQFAGYFGGGAGYRNRTWTAPSFSIAQLSRHGENTFTTYDNVASAFEGVNGSMKNLNDRINKIENNAVSGSISEGLNWSKKKESYDTSHNNNDSKIINVAEGDVKKSSEDIVTGDQLWETNKKTEDIADNTKNDIAIFSYDHDKKSSNKKSSITLKGADESDPVLIDNIAHEDTKEEPKKNSKC
ncbi:hypothetical protein ABID23_001087 [Bartonella silvatica]|uniref:Trimeric autotransporter adhesin YadA-like stalk domain-containing protein n=1 Tax=Bartonella silvatica TaxID=357760 RepID=A0ABV2HHF7_9HYPH